MAMVKLCSFAPGQDLALVRDHLNAQALPYEIREADRGGAELWVDDSHLEAAAGVLDRLIQPSSGSSAGSRGALAGAFLRTWPLSLATVVLGIAGYLLVLLAPQWIAAFTFTKVTFYYSYVASVGAAETYWVEHQWWRLISPAFLHFGLWHVLFNSMAVWELGRRLEFVLPRYIYGLILLSTAVAANVVQHMLPGSDVFGGLSGVVFGLFGAIMVLYRRTVSPVLKLPRGLYILALVSLVLMPFVLDNVFSINVANGAHVGGLLAGLALGMLVPVNRVRRLPGETSPTYP
jgi:GlpG protein